jgi:hypothetical protein
MKQLTLATLALMILLTDSGSAASKKTLMKVKALDTIAVISITSDIAIKYPWEKEDPSQGSGNLEGLKAAAAMKKGESVKEAYDVTGHTMETVVEAAPPTIMRNIDSLGIWNVIPMDEVLSNETYQSDLSAPVAIAKPKLSPESWKTIVAGDKGKIKAIAGALGVDAVMIVDIKPRFAWSVGVGFATGTAKGQATVTATLVAPNGARIWSANRQRTSDGSAIVFQGTYLKPAVDKLLGQAIDEASMALFTNLKTALDKL